MAGDEPKDWLPPAGDWLAQNAGDHLIALAETVVEPEDAEKGRDRDLAELSAARVQQMLEKRHRSLSRPSSGRGLAMPPVPSGGGSAMAPAAVQTRPRPLLPRSLPQPGGWRQAPAGGRPGPSQDVIASLQARLSHVEKLNQHQAARLANLTQEVEALRAENAMLRAEEATWNKDDMEDVEDEVRLLRIERDEYKEQFQAMTKFLQDYGLTWVGEEEGEKDDTVAAKLSRPGSSQGVDTEVMATRVAELNALVRQEGARIVATRGPGGGRQARLVADDTTPLPLSFFKDGLKLGGLGFQSFSSRSAQQLLQDILDGYFPYELKKDYPDGVMLKVVDRTMLTFSAWKEQAASDPELHSSGDRLAIGGGKVLNANGGALPDKVLRHGDICEAGPKIHKRQNLWCSSQDEDASDVMEVMAWCKGVIQGLDWPAVLRLAKSECNLDAGDEELLRIGCSEVGLVSALEGLRALLEIAQLQRPVCPNGQIFVLAVTLAYAREQLSALEVSKAQVLLWQALQTNFMLDASVWPVKTHDVLYMFDHLPAPLKLEGPRPGRMKEAAGAPEVPQNRAGLGGCEESQERIQT
ncbi:unnamed protein product [Effrenium voratum]|nr:unnamed protein product [Effrenium voratum]